MVWRVVYVCEYACSNPNVVFVDLLSRDVKGDRERGAGMRASTSGKIFDRWSSLFTCIRSIYGHAKDVWRNPRVEFP